MSRTRKNPERYSAEHKRFVSWLEEARRQAVLSSCGGDTERAKPLPVINEENGSTYLISTGQRAETVDDGYAYMVTGILAAMKTCRFCEDAKAVIHSALQGYSLFYGSKDESRKSNRMILRAILHARIRHELNSVENSWFYVSIDSIFNRPAAVCFGLFDIASLLPEFLRVTAGEGDGADKAAVIGAKQALQDIWQYFREVKPKKITVENFFARIMSGEPLFGNLWGSFHEYQGSELLSEDLLTSLTDEEVWESGVEIYDCESEEGADSSCRCPEWEVVKNDIDCLIRDSFGNRKMNRDQRNGYQFFLSGLRRWIDTALKDGGTSFPLMSALVYLLTGIDRLETPFCFNGEETESRVHFYELLNAVILDNPEMSREVWLQMLNPSEPLGGILNPQVTAATSLLLCTESLIGSSLLPATEGKAAEGIENPESRMEGMITAMADLLGVEGMMMPFPVYADIRDENYHRTIRSIIDTLTLTPEVSD